MKLNLGCGKDWKIHHPEYEGLDIEDFGQKYTHDLLQPLPFKSESIDGLMAWNTLEHLPTTHLISIMNECWRVIKRMKHFHIKVPHFPNANSVADPTHLSFWTPRSFDYWAGNKPRNADYGIKKWAIVGNKHGLYDMEVTPKQVDIKLYKK